MRSTQESVQGAAAWLHEHAPMGANLRVDSRAVQPGDVYVALPGRHRDGMQYAASAKARGASAILADEACDFAKNPQAPDYALRRVARLSRDLGWIASEFYGDPTARLRTVGVTGTNGKTSTCLWVAQLLETFGVPCATIGTLGFGFPGAIDADETQLTTPDAASVQRLARRALDAGARALAMEVSSIGLDQGRVDGVSFAIALFTNLTRDHLDYHSDMGSYAAAKRRLFDWPGLAHAVLNLDDEFGLERARALTERGQAVIGFATNVQAGKDLGLAWRLLAQDVQHQASGMRFQVHLERDGATDSMPIEAAVIGDFNLSNLLGVLGVAIACGIPLRDAAAALARLEAPPGRLQRVTTESRADSDGPLAIVDYAHTPDAIVKALHALRPVARARGGRLWIVFGAGGDRDPGKRPEMGAAAATAADVVVLTSDNPRSEDPQSIVEQIARGIPAGKSFALEVDRGHAIARAIGEAAPSDVVLIAGKGHEPYQEIGGRRHPFSDFAVARSALLARSGA
jgi:UDP-N-acetylmuramoyl-L-alanyl-D-glutamate--2,6-diaminopimelate ligase